MACRLQRLLIVGLGKCEIERPLVGQYDLKLDLCATSPNRFECVSANHHHSCRPRLPRPIFGAWPRVPVQESGAGETAECGGAGQVP